MSTAYQPRDLIVWKWILAVSVVVIVAIGSYAVLSRDDYPKPATDSLSPETSLESTFETVQPNE